MLEQNKDKKTQIKDRLKKDEKEITCQSRYGFFSIPYNSTISDGYYSQEALYHHKVINRQVLGERRGIYTKPGKSGKGKDAYLKCMDYTEEKEIEKLKAQVVNEQNNYLKQIQERQKATFSIPFTPAGGQFSNKYKSNNGSVNTKKLTKQIRKTDIPHFNALNNTISNNNSTSNQKGFYNTTGILFKLPVLPLNVEVWDIKTIENLKKKNKPFVPVSLKSNCCFISNKETYGNCNEGLKLYNPSMVRTNG